MKKKLIFLIVGISIALIPISMSDKIFAVSNSITGTITDSNSNTIYANIYLLQNGSPIYSFTTNKINGQFSSSIQSGTYQVIFSQVNQSANEPRFFYLNRTATISSSLNVNLVFPIITISGQIIDSNNQPVAGAVIDSGIGSVNISGYGGTVQDFTKTDSNGNYVLHLFPATFQNVKITLQNGIILYPTSGKSVTLSSSSTQNIKLATAVTVSGTITDGSLNPASARIDLVNGDLTETIYTNPTTGAYSFNVQPNNYLVKISSVNKTSNLPRFFEGERQYDILSGATVNLSIPVESWTGTGLKWQNGTLFTGIAQFYMPLNLGGWIGSSGDQIQVTNGAFSLKLLTPTGTIATESFGTPNPITCNANTSTKTIIC